MNTFLTPRALVVKNLEQNYNGQYGKYKYYAGQTFVFKKDNFAYKTVLIRKPSINGRGDDPSQFIKVSEVYEGDTLEVLKTTITEWESEYNWYKTNFTEVLIPSEEYSICKDPLGTENNTILIKAPWVKNIIGDIFRIDSKKMYSFIVNFPDFKLTLISLIRKFVDLAKKDIYPDYLGADNVAVYVENGVPKIAMIDPHIVIVGKFCNEALKNKLSVATTRFEGFLSDPLSIKNIELLTSGDFDD